MAPETRIERWRRTGLLQLVVALVVLGVWVYFQKSTAPADRPVILNEVLLLALGWLGSTFLFKRDDDDDDAAELEPAAAKRKPVKAKPKPETPEE